MAMVGRRQIGSTMKPYVYSLAMENGFSPCDEMRHVEFQGFDENGNPDDTSDRADITMSMKFEHYERIFDNL